MIHTLYESLASAYTDLSRTPATSFSNPSPPDLDASISAYKLILRKRGRKKGERSEKGQGAAETYVIRWDRGCTRGNKEKTLYQSRSEFQTQPGPEPNWIALCSSFQTRFQGQHSLLLRCQALYRARLYIARASPYSRSASLWIVQSAENAAEPTDQSISHSHPNLLSLDRLPSPKILTRAL